MSWILKVSKSHQKKLINKRLIFRYLHYFISWQCLLTQINGPDKGLFLS